MKLLYVELARTLWMFDVRLINPSGLSAHKALRAIADKYQFSKVPQHPLDYNKDQALAFELGTFLNSKKQEVSVNFTIYNNALVVDTISSTQDATEFLDDLRTWITEHGLKIPQNLQKAYVSQLDVQSNVSLESLQPKLLPFMKSLSAKVKSADGKARDFAFGGIQLWTEDVNTPPAPAVFRFERKWGPPFASNHYYSQAPLETDEHLAMLTDLEKLLQS